MRKIFVVICLLILLVGCENRETIESWNVEDYEALDEIVKIDEIVEDASETASTYKVRYISGGCEVVAYLSVPETCLQNEEKIPCIIYNRGGNRDFSANHPSTIAQISDLLGKCVFASQYRGVDGGTGMEEFGGAEVQDVICLIDISEKFSFVKTDEIYMMGVSRGGMMTYQAIREDERIKKAVVVSGLADAFISYEERPDMRGVVYEALVGGTPEELPEEYEKRSATYWADELKCPVLIIHSKLDRKVSYAQAEKMVSCLEEANKEYKFVSYEDDRHGVRPEDVEVLLEWFH